MTNENSNYVSIIDTTTNAVAATVDVIDEPYGVAVNPRWNKGIRGKPS